MVAPRIYGGQAVTRRQRHERITQLAVEDCIDSHEHGIDMFCGESSEGCAGVALVRDLKHAQPQPECLCRELEVPDLRLDAARG